MDQAVIILRSGPRIWTRLRRMELDFSRFSIRNVFFFMILEGPTVRYFNHITICLAIIVLRNGLVLGKEHELI